MTEARAGWSGAGGGGAIGAAGAGGGGKGPVAGGPKAGATGAAAGWIGSTVVAPPELLLLEKSPIARGSFTSCRVVAELSCRDRRGLCVEHLRQAGQAGADFG